MVKFLQNVQEILKTQLFTIAETPVNLLTLITFVLIVVFTVIFSKLLQRALVRVLHRRGIQDEGSVGVMTRITHYLVMATGLGIGLHTLGINFTTLFAAGAVFAIAIGFAMQNIAQNFMSGLILLSERSIKPGDVLQVDGVMVKVGSLGTRSTVARTLDDEDLIVPNSNLVQSTVKNYTLKDSLYRIRTVVGVAYSSDMELVRETLSKAAEDIDGRVMHKSPTVFLIAFGNSSVDFEVSIWVESPWTARATRSHLNTSIWWALKDAGITIAFPQMDVHFDAEVAATLSRSPHDDA